MKSKFSFLVALAAIVLSSQNVNAKIRRVGYFGNPVSGTDYSDLQSAIDESQRNDTLLIFPGNWQAAINRKYVILGAGYGITGAGSNSGLQNITGAMSTRFYLNEGSDSTLFQGLDNLGIAVSNPNNTPINAVKINRCVLNGYNFDANKGLSNYYRGALNNWQITQCWDVYITNSYSNFSNLLVSNSYLSKVALLNSVANTGLLSNNIFDPNAQLDLGNGGFQLQNNIFTGSNCSNNSNSIYNNCICNTDYFSLPAGNGNQSLSNTQFNNLFVGYPTQGSYSFDSRWALKAGSLAIGTGAGGVDCGMFGTTAPYKLSGIPPIPAFYKLTAPSNTTSTNPYTITFSVRTNN